MNPSSAVILRILFGILLTASTFASPDAQSGTHWAWSAPRRPMRPEIRASTWPRGAIDHFVLARLESEGLAPSVEADRQALIRRVTLDLTGLPPTIDEIDAFLADESPDAYRRVVHSLFASPRHAEHMAVAWLDAARYADTNGYNNDTPRYNWRYRDWVIGAFRRNLPYDRFITEQLAGDLLPNASLDQQIATGFNRNHNVTSEGGIIDEEYRLEYVADRVHTASTVFMGLTLRCARCHDHKFDPISQREYYEFFAFFDQIPEKGYHKEHVGNVKPVIQAPTAEQQAALARLDEEEKRLAAADEGDERSEVEIEKRKKAKEDLARRRKELTKKIPTAMVMRDAPKRRDTFFLERGAYDRPGAKVEPGVPKLLSSLQEKDPRSRLGVARWLTRASHPLTARVIVNRLWYQIFGNGIVTTLEDFGTQGAKPTHPELLDWLAVELVESEWNLRHVFELIVSSASYRQSSFATEALLEVDPSNQLLARGPRFRMTAEMVRDSALAVSGLLVHRLGGPSVRPYQPRGLWVEVAVRDDSYSGGPYVQDHGPDLYRRSVYTWWKRTCPPPNLSTFDAPDREFCRVQRSRTVTPLQALVLLNDPTFVEAARVLAARTMSIGDRKDSREAGEDVDAKAAWAFRRVTSRRPRDVETRVLSSAFRRYRDLFRRDGAAAKKLLGVGETKRDPKLDEADLAAWTAVVSMILNLDESITKG
jgi:hypothetical protein